MCERRQRFDSISGLCLLIIPKYYKEKEKLKEVLFVSNPSLATEDALIFQATSATEWQRREKSEELISMHCPRT